MFKIKIKIIVIVVVAAVVVVVVEEIVVVVVIIIVGNGGGNTMAVVVVVVAVARNIIIGSRMKNYKKSKNQKLRLKNWSFQIEPEHFDIFDIFRPMIGLNSSKCSYPEGKMHNFISAVSPHQSQKLTLLVPIPFCTYRWRRNPSFSIKQVYYETCQIVGIINLH